MCVCCTRTQVSDPESNDEKVLKFLQGQEVRLVIESEVSVSSYVYTYTGGVPETEGQKREVTGISGHVKGEYVFVLCTCIV